MDSAPSAPFHGVLWGKLRFCTFAVLEIYGHLWWFWIREVKCLRFIITGTSGLNSAVPENANLVGLLQGILW